MTHVIVKIKRGKWENYIIKYTEGTKVVNTEFQGGKKVSVVTDPVKTLL